MQEYDEKGRPIIDPEIVEDEKYQRAYSEKAFEGKLMRFAKKLGREGLRQALQLFYVLRRKDLPGKTRALILGSLGYFILPVDLVPDFIPLLGIGDDLSLIAAAFLASRPYVDAEVRAKTEAKLQKWLGSEK